MEADKTFAFRVAADWHRYVGRLFASKRAMIVWGEGGKEMEDREAYSKKYRRQYGGAKWKNAGVFIADGHIVIQTYHGLTVARLFLPSESARDLYEPSKQLLQAWSRKRTAPKNDSEFLSLCTVALSLPLLEVARERRA